MGRALALAGTPECETVRAANPAAMAEQGGTGDRTEGRGAGGRTLITGWFSFAEGEATAGDVLALHRLRQEVERGGGRYDIAWSPGFVPGGFSLEDADPGAYGHLLFVCGPLHGRQVEWLHDRFAGCRRIAVGVSVVDAGSRAVTGFHHVLPRDRPHGGPGTLDLAATAPAGASAGAPTPPAAPAVPAVPVVGVVLTYGQREYAERRDHDAVAEAVTGWLHGKNCARLDLDTRLDAHDRRHCATPEQFLAAVSRLDLVVTDRLHGLVLALREGVPALAVDPVRGGAKVTAQAAACRWPALVPSEALTRCGREEPYGAGELERWWAWCLGAGRALARERAAEFRALRAAAAKGRRRAGS